jgi:integrase
MPKTRTGFVFQEKTWYAVVDYTDKKRQRQKLKQQAKSKKHAEKLAEQMLREMEGQALKSSSSVCAQSGSWFARFDYTDESGRRRNVKRRAENKTHAKELLKQLVRQFEDRGPRLLETDKMTFGDLAAYYEKNFLIPAEYVDGRKVAGLRALPTAETFVKALKAHFASRRLRTITHGDLQRYRALRLKTKTVRKKQRSIASVNREMSMLRRMFGVAEREGWIIKNPFSMGEPLITPADERKRERIITKEEEERLLAACTGRRIHLQPIIICALDTGMRRGEIIKLRWSDIDFENRIIFIQAHNTKTLRERQMAISERLTLALQTVYEQSTKDPLALVFGILDNVKKGFHSARKDAGLPDVRFHDLRHTHATRLVTAHIPLSEVGRALGHTQPSTTYRYVNANVDTARRVVAAIDAFNEPKSEEVVIN